MISNYKFKEFNFSFLSDLLHSFFFCFFDLQCIDIGEDMNVPDDFTANEMASGKVWRHLAAGGIAGSYIWIKVLNDFSLGNDNNETLNSYVNYKLIGAVSRTFTAPLDRVKIFLQIQSAKVSIGDSFRYMLKEGGVSSFWRGNGINVIKIAPESAIKFAAYEQVKRLIRRNKNRPMSIYERFAAGACAGGISQTAIYPLEVLKTRLALRKTGQYKSILDAALKIHATEGVKSFYRGYIPNILGKQLIHANDEIKSFNPDYYSPNSRYHTICWNWFSCLWNTQK